MRVDLDENSFGGVDVDLETTGFVERRVEEREEALEKKSVGGWREGFGQFEGRRKRRR